MINLTLYSEKKDPFPFNGCGRGFFYNVYKIEPKLKYLDDFEYVEVHYSPDIIYMKPGTVYPPGITVQEIKYNSRQYFEVYPVKKVLYCSWDGVADDVFSKMDIYSNTSQLVPSIKYFHTETKRNIHLLNEKEDVADTLEEALEKYKQRLSIIESLSEK